MVRSSVTIVTSRQKTRLSVFVSLSEEDTTSECSFSISVSPCRFDSSWGNVGSRVGFVVHCDFIDLWSSRDSH